MLAQLKEKIVSIEAQIQQAMSNHSYLAGALAALKEALSIAETVAPASPAVEVIEEVVNVANDIESALEPVAPVAPAAE